MSSDNYSDELALGRKRAGDIMQYTAIIEKEADTDWGAYVPDLSGCVPVGETRTEVETLIREAIELHLKGMREDGELIPVPNSTAIVVNVAA